MSEKLETVITVIDHFLSCFKIYRRLRGGRWEKWWIDVPVCSAIWFRNESPGGLARGTPTVEDYTK
jgi:hypothetical protein